MLIFDFCIDTTFVIDYVKTALFSVDRNFPTIIRIFKKVLVKISDTVVVGFVNLTNTFAFDCLLYGLSVYL